MDATVESPPDIRELIESGRQARAFSYVPYSKFAMGASVRFDSGHLVPGAVVENVSLGLAMCAERAALFAGVALGYGKPLALALVAPATDGALTYPCGACLQVALELGGPDLVVLAAAADSSAIEQRTIGELLPYAPRKARSRGHQMA
jgi:cytidine deaminase